MARNSRFRTTSGSSNKPKPFNKKDNDGFSSDKKGRGKFSSHPNSAKSSADRPKPFPKKEWKKTIPEKGSAVDPVSERKPKSFSRDQEKSGYSKKQDRQKDGYSGTKRPERKGTDSPRPGARKSFVESRLDRQRKNTPSLAPDVSPGPKDDLIRLNKFISNSGVCSRREADELIAMGLITVNGVSITEMGYKVKPTDDVRHDGKRLRAEKPVYILLNKPKGFITTTDDPQERNTVMQLISGACKERVYPVGRLDRNTSGLLLLTNDGDLTDKLTHPSYNVKKIYKAELDRPLTKNDLQKIIDGIHLEEGKVLVDDIAIVSDDGKTVGLELHIGWNRIVRRIFESLGYEVVKLDRSVYATLDKKNLPRGNWRFLRQDEIIRLKHFQ